MCLLHDICLHGHLSRYTVYACSGVACAVDVQATPLHTYNMFIQV